MKNFPVVILPGWLLSSERYAELTKEFTDSGFKTYVVDFPGFHPKYPLTRTLNLADYVKFLQKYLRLHKIERAIFVAHSFGGRVAFKYLSQEPRKAAALIITGTPGFLTVSRIKLRFYFYLAKFGGALFSIPLVDKIKDPIRKVFYKLVGAKDFYHAQGFTRETFKKIIAEELVEYMRKMHVPTLLVWGEKDKTVPVKIARRMQKVLFKSELVIVPTVGHMLPCKEPEVFVHEVNKFLAQL